MADLDCHLDTPEHLGLHLGTVVLFQPPHVLQGTPINPLVHQAGLGRTLFFSLSLVLSGVSRHLFVSPRGSRRNAVTCRNASVGWERRKDLGLI